MADLLTKKHSVMEYAYVSGARTFEVPFTLGILNEAHIQVYIRGEVDGLGEQVYRDFSLDMGTMTITVTDPISPPAGKAYATVVLWRTIPKEELHVAFSNGADVTRTNLDKSQLAIMMAFHEVLDGRTEAYDIILAMVQEVEGMATQVTADRIVAAAAALSASDDADQTALDRIAVAADRLLSQTAATTATTKAGEASASASTASTAKNAAVAAKEDAELAASAASGSASAASGSASAASGSASAASGSASAAASARDKAQEWADNAEDVAVEAGKFSAKHWAAKAEENAAAVGALYYYPENYGAPKDGTSDDTPGIQAAINAAAVNGGTVYLGVGEWTLKSQLVLKRGAALKGAGYHFIESTQQIKGTILNVEWGNGTGGAVYQNRTKAAVLVESGTKITDLAFDYPAQTGASPIEYGPTIFMYEPLNAAVDAYLSNVILERLFIYRSYVGVHAKGSTSKASGVGNLTTHRYTDVVMSVYHRCFRIDRVTDWFIIDKCEQQPGFLGFNVTPGASQRDYCQKNCVMFEFDGLCDWIQVRNCNMWQGSRAVEFWSAIGPFTFVNCEFDAIRLPIYFEANCTTTRTEARFIGCTFTAFDAIQDAAGTGYYNSQVCVVGANTTVEGVHFRDCTILGPTVGLWWSKNAGSVINRLTVQGCVSKVEDKSHLSGYTAPQTFVDVAGFAQKVIIVGNMCAGFPVVQNSTATQKEVGYNIL